ILANSRTEMENIEQNECNINDENNEHDVGEIFKKVKVDDGSLFSNPKEDSFQCGKVPVELM
ncbi:14367_t:CDS:1, partial [Funneliformis geosporum]